MTHRPTVPTDRALHNPAMLSGFASLDNKSNLELPVGYVASSSFGKHNLESILPAAKHHADERKWVSLVLCILIDRILVGLALDLSAVHLAEGTIPSYKFGHRDRGWGAV